MNRTVHARSIAAILVTTTLMGCAGHGGQQEASMGDIGGPTGVVSLGAGDSLGRAVYVNDLIIAAAALDKNTTFTNVDEGSTQLLMDH